MHSHPPNKRRAFKLRSYIGQHHNQRQESSAADPPLGGGPTQLAHQWDFIYTPAESDL